jgi:hypothetical protein
MVSGEWRVEFQLAKEPCRGPQIKPADLCSPISYSLFAIREVPQ